MKECVKKEIEKIIKKENLNCSIKEFKNYVNWDYISYSQKLSLDFIREFKDKVNWHCISHSQKLSEDFILEFKDKVDWDYIEKYQKITKKDIEEYEEELKEKEKLQKTRVKNKFQLIRF